MGSIFIAGDDTGDVTAQSGVPATGDLSAWEWDLLAGEPSPDDLDDPVVASWSISTPPTFGTATLVPDTIGVTVTWVYTLDDTHPAVQDLEFGESLTDTFVVRAVSADGDNLFAGVRQVEITVFGVCFAGGTLIETEDGPVAVENLSAGQKVLTQDNGLQSIVWVDGREIEPERWKNDPKLLPVRIKAGALSKGIPSHDLYVSQQHRIQISGAAMELLFGSFEVLVSAKNLCQHPGVDIVKPPMSLSYHHILCNQHQVLSANGAPAESLFLGNEALMTMGSDSLNELQEIFGDYTDCNGKSGLFSESVKPVLTGHQTRLAVHEMA